MPIVNIGVVRMAVGQGQVPMWMRVRFFDVNARSMFVMAMKVIMLEQFMLVVVIVRFGRVQVNPNGHERCCHPEHWTMPLSKHQHGDVRACEGRRREAGACPRSTGMTQREDEQKQAESVPSCLPMKQTNFSDDGFASEKRS